MGSLSTCDLTFVSENKFIVVQDRWRLLQVVNFFKIHYILLHFSNGFEIGISSTVIEK